MISLNIRRFASTPDMHLPNGEVKSYSGPSPLERDCESEIQQIRAEQIMTPSDLVRIVELERKLAVERYRAEHDNVTSKKAYATLSDSAAVAAATIKLMDDPNQAGESLDRDSREGYVELIQEKEGGLEATSFRYDTETGNPVIFAESDSMGLNTTEFRWDKDGHLSEAHIKRQFSRTSGWEEQTFDFKREELDSLFLTGTSMLRGGRQY